MCLTISPNLRGRHSTGINTFTPQAVLEGDTRLLFNALHVIETVLQGGQSVKGTTVRGANRPL